jgi:uncharacterized protein (TIGR02598 family)
MKCATKYQRPEYNKTAPVVSPNDQTGFSLVEVVIALVILLVALLGVFMTFTYAINYNSGNYARTRALVVLQQEVERMRSGKFTNGVTDDGQNGKPDLRGGVQTPRTVRTDDDQHIFRVSVTIDDNPSTPNVVDVNANTTLKHITITVTSVSPTPGWQTAVPATAVIRRVRAN